MIPMYQNWSLIQVSVQEVALDLLTEINDAANNLI